MTCGNFAEFRFGYGYLCPVSTNTCQVIATCWRMLPSQDRGRATDFSTGKCRARALSARNWTFFVTIVMICFCRYCRHHYCYCCSYLNNPAQGRWRYLGSFDVNRRAFSRQAYSANIVSATNQILSFRISAATYPLLKLVTKTTYRTHLSPRKSSQTNRRSPVFDCISPTPLPSFASAFPRKTAWPPHAPPRPRQRSSQIDSSAPRWKHCTRGASSRERRWQHPANEAPPPHHER